MLVDQSCLDDIVALLDHDASGIAALAIDIRETPDHVSSPAGLSDDVALDVRLASWTALLLLALEPALLQVGLLDVVEGDEARLARELAEDVVLVLVLLPVQRAQLGRALQPAGRRLLDVDVHQPGVVRVLLDVQIDRGQADGRPGHPAHALQGEDWVRVIGEGFVLRARGGQGLVILRNCISKIFEIWVRYIFRRGI